MRATRFDDANRSIHTGRLQQRHDMDIHPADKAYRTRALLFLGGTAVLCVILLWQLNLWLGRVTGELMQSDPETLRDWLRALLAGLGIAMAAPAAALGFSLRKLALAARIEGRFPPREWKTWRDVRVLRDAAALRWARRIETAGNAALGVAALFLAWAIVAWLRFS